MSWTTLFPIAVLVASLLVAVRFFAQLSDERRPGPYTRNATTPPHFTDPDPLQPADPSWASTPVVDEPHHDQDHAHHHSHHHAPAPVPTHTHDTSSHSSSSFDSGSGGGHHHH